MVGQSYRLASQSATWHKSPIIHIFIVDGFGGETPIASIPVDFLTTARLDRHYIDDLIPKLVRSLPHTRWAFVEEDNELKDIDLTRASIYHLRIMTDRGGFLTSELFHTGLG
jgi:hypothetical protein